MTTPATASYPRTTPSTTPRSNIIPPPRDNIGKRGEGLQGTRRAPAALAELGQRRQWVGWKFGDVRANGKRGKIPIDTRTGKKAKPNDPETWGTYEDAVAAVGRFGLVGIGFVFSKDDPYCGLDLDDCRDPASGLLHPEAKTILDSLGSYAEISPSGTGVKAIVRAVKTGRRCAALGPWGGKIELYDANRFFALTGEVLRPGNDVIADAGEATEDLYDRMFSDDGEGKANTATPRRRTSGRFVAKDDAELLDLARNKGRRQLFRKLYHYGDTSGFASQSEADLALCAALAFWTLKDEKWIDRLFRGSALMRPKWDNRRGGETYGQRTIRLAIKRCENVYTRAPGRPEDTVRKLMEEAARLVNGLTWDGQGGISARKVWKALINTGWVWGKVCGDGVAVAASARDIMPEAGIGDQRTVMRAIAYLARLGLVAVLDEGGPRRAATYLLKPSPPSHHKNTHHPCVSYGGIVATRKMRAPHNPPRKAFDKNGRPIRTYVGAPEKRLPTRCEQVLDLVIALEVATLHEIAAHMGMNTPDGRYKLKKRFVEPLVDRGLLADSRGVYSVPVGVERVFSAYLEATGSSEAERLQRARIARERAAQEVQLRGGLNDSHDDPDRAADGFIEDLEPLEDGPEILLPEHDESKGLGCECLDCSAPAPRYVTPTGSMGAGPPSNTELP